MMNKRVLYIGVWNYKLLALINFLNEKDYSDKQTISELEFMLNESNKLHEETIDA